MSRFPCGKCGGCLSSRSSSWSIRLAHELKSHDQSAFITLTYAVDVGSVSKQDAQLFLKRLRFYLEPKRIRYYLVSEYGDKSKRPHYHAIIFGHDFSKDPGAHQVRQGLFTSKLLEKAWGKGHVSSGTVTEASIRYVTNYILGKEGTPPGCERTFALMSRKPGLGSAWFDRHTNETYRTDTVVVSGFERTPPRYYDNRLKQRDPGEHQRVKDGRRATEFGKMLSDPEMWLSNNHPDRRIAEGKIRESRKKMTQGEI